MEYKEFAKYYDNFYQNKNYEKEVNFLKHFIDKEDTILDIGCGTGIHLSLLEQSGYNVEGLDLNEEMLEIAKTRLKCNLYNQNILDININKRYDVIISMFAVINHLKDIRELEQVLLNLKNILNTNGKIILDLHNPQNSGTKTDTFDNMTRTMTWNYNKETKLEESNIVFKIDDEVYNDSHTFRIFSIEEIENICEKVGLKLITVFENYDNEIIGNELSKNLQFIIEKNQLQR